ncbi:MAG: flavodoxin domain-containing protein [Synergistales bacterium]|nr:flavodoxin domain-containing protein [Synergistales bacterium]
MNGVHLMIPHKLPGMKPGTGFKPNPLVFLLFCLVAFTTGFFAGCAHASTESDLQGLPSLNEGSSGPSAKLKGSILVAYETKKGSTREVAEAIASEIRSCGWDATAMDIKGSPSPEEYDHVILGGPVYMGKIKEVRAYVQRHEEELKERLAGAFAVGMSFAVAEEEQQASGRKALDDAIAPMKATHLGYFAGRIDPAKLSLIEKGMIKMVKSPVGDFRDWDAIKAWAREVITDLKR